MIVSLMMVVWPIFPDFHPQLWSQIYTITLLFPRHAPYSRVPHHHPLQPPEAQATSVVSVRRVACTRQRAFYSLAHVTATSRFLWPCTVLVEVYGS
jgi:hypothetical protein